MIQQILSSLFQKAKEHSIPIALSLIISLLGILIAIIGPDFNWPHWSAIIFPPFVLLFLTLSLFYLGASLGAIAIYILCSFILLEIILGYLTGRLSDDLLCATATSGGFHHFHLLLFLWLLSGIGFTFFLKRFFIRNFIAAAGFFSLAFCLFILNLPLSFYYSHFRLTLHLSPKVELGVTHEGHLLPLSTPNLLSQFAYEIRHASPGIIGDVIALAAFAHDPGADSLPRVKHPTPQHLQPSPKSAVPNLVLIMGESSTSTHYHSYGYGVETTPELDKILSKNNACEVPKVHSAANQTRDAVLPSVSLWFPQDLKQGMGQANLIELAKRQGYKTYWASAQSERGAYSGFIGYVAKYANHFIDPETAHFTFQGKSFSLKSETDESLLPLFEAFSNDQKAAKKKFILLHLWGSHLPYKEKVRQEDIAALPHATRYDQSIHRTDRLLSQIVQIAEKNLDHPLILYLPDHGEDPLNSGGHGLSFGGKDYQIPLILIGDKAKENCAYIEKLRAENGWYSSNMNKFLILHNLGLDAEQNWIDTQRNPDLVLHVGGTVYRWGEIPGQHLHDA